MSDAKNVKTFPVYPSTVILLIERKNRIASDLFAVFPKLANSLLDWGGGPVMMPMSDVRRLADWLDTQPNVLMVRKSRISREIKPREFFLYKKPKDGYTIIADALDCTLDGHSPYRFALRNGINPDTFYRFYKEEGSIVTARSATYRLAVILGISHREASERFYRNSFGEIDENFSVGFKPKPPEHRKPKKRVRKKKSA